jgi:hypothetical protein
VRKAQEAGDRATLAHLMMQRPNGDDGPLQAERKLDETIRGKREA